MSEKPRPTRKALMREVSLLNAELEALRLSQRSEHDRTADLEADLILMETYEKSEQEQEAFRRAAVRFLEREASKAEEAEGRADEHP